MNENAKIVRDRRLDAVALPLDVPGKNAFTRTASRKSNPINRIENKADLIRITQISGTCSARLPSFKCSPIRMNFVKMSAFSVAGAR